MSLLSASFSDARRERRENARRNTHKKDANPRARRSVFFLFLFSNDGHFMRHVWSIAASFRSSCNVHTQSMTTPRDLLCRFHIIIVRSIDHIPSSNERHARGNLRAKKQSERKVSFVRFSASSSSYFLRSLRAASDWSCQIATNRRMQRAAVFACTDRRRRRTSGWLGRNAHTAEGLLLLGSVDNQLC